MVTAALEYAERGWPVIPLHSPTAAGCSCGRTDCKSLGKHPRTDHGWKNGSRDPATIREWWQRWPDANIGIVTGLESGIFVLDVDGRQGEESLTELAQRGCHLPDTYTVRSGGGGRHLYFLWPEGADVRNSQSMIAPGLDIRGQGGYVVAPPSVHASGARYERLNETSIDIVSPCLTRLTSLSPPRSRQRNDAMIRAGERRSTFFRRGCALRGRGMDRDGILAALMQDYPRCEQPPAADHAFSEEEVRELVENICLSFPAGSVRPDARQTLPDFLRTARERNNFGFITRSKYRTPLFDFARLVKSRAEFAGMTGIQAAERIDREVGNIWQEWFADVSDDPRAQLVADWNAARSAVGDDDSLDAAWREAQHCPVAPAHNISERYCRFLALCAVLQRKAGLENPVPLGQVRIGGLLGCDYTTIGSYIKCASKDGLLQRVKPCVPHSRAAEYVYSGPGLSPEGTTPEQLPLSPKGFLPEKKPILTRGTEYQDGIGENASGKNAHPKTAIPEAKRPGPGYIEGRL
jgi:hypothetical protein